jgi:quinol monooxygenase YgiN
MIIVAGYSLAKSGEDRDASVAAFAPMVERARKQDGCVDMAISADALDPTRSNLLEIWRDEAAWKAWQKVAKGPRSKPKEVHVSLYRAEIAKSF